MCFVVYKTTSELERVILTTLHLVGAKNTNMILQGSGVEAAVLGGMDIYVRSGHRVWFLLRNDTEAPLPMFTSSRPMQQPKWGHGVAKKDLHRLQTLRDVIQWLVRGRLTGMDLLQTFVSHRIQPLH
jgi:hypothetical protein